MDAPALVVGEVQVQGVELQSRGAVDVGLDGLDGEEVARDVEHHAAVGEARCVLDLHGGDREAVAVAAAMSWPSVCTP